MPFDFWFPHNLVFWGAIVLIVLAVSYFNHRTRASKHRMLETLAEKGQQITPELIDRIERMKHKNN
jgi:hypothetical protein